MKAATLVYVALAASLALNVAQYGWHDFSKGMVKESRLRIVRATEAHRDALSVVARGRLQADAVAELRALRLKVTVDQQGRYLDSEIASSETCTRALEHEGDGVLSLPTPCVSAGAR